MPKPLAIENVRLELHGGMRNPWVLSCDHAGAHFHVWLKHSFAPDVCVYKKPHGADEIANPRALYLENSRPMRELVAAMLEVMHREQLGAKAQAADAEKRAQAEAERLERARAYQVREAAPCLLSALEGMITHLPELWGDQVAEGELTLKVDASALQAALAVIAAAKRTPL